MNLLASNQWNLFILYVPNLTEQADSGDKVSDFYSEVPSLNLGWDTNLCD
jgi:hypothetical protein